ncbi:MAG: DEAD/DEAH box helicase, partial [Rhodomicrobium sp.]|nr:DEAD/DEAH box helicase [Rhodomicrobium sp.]
AKIEWIDGEPSTENLTSADFSERRERTRRERGKGSREERKDSTRREADVRPLRGNSTRRDRDSSVSRYHRELLPPATSAPVVGLGDHVPEFLKRPVRAAS